MNKALAIVGPTSSGKSDLAITLARDFDGEIISADSRQVYKHMDIGSGKVTKTEQKLAPHHLLDIVHPTRDYNVATFLRDAKKVRAEIEQRAHVPIVCGGTGFWIQSLIENRSFPEVAPNPKLRSSLSRLKTETLYKKLIDKDTRRAEAVDPSNRVYIIRALEIIDALGKVPPAPRRDYHEINNTWRIIAVTPNKEILHERIEQRLTKRLRRGMLAEIRRLHDRHGVGYHRLEEFGLEYKWCALHVQKKITREEMIEGILKDSHHYAKRQMTWLRRWKRMGAFIHWVDTDDEAKKIVKLFLT